MYRQKDTYNIELFGWKFTTEHFFWMIVVMVLAITMQILVLIGFILVIGYVADYTDLHWFLALALVLYITTKAETIFSGNNSNN